MGKLATKARDALDVARELKTVDGWQNLVTNMGVLGKDKAESTRFAPRKLPLSWQEIESLYSQDGMGAKIVDEIVEDAFRCGWRVTFQADEDEKANAERVNEFNAQLEDWHKRVNFLPNAEESLKQSRWSGGSLLVMGVTDGGRPMEPVEPERVRSIDFVRPVDRFQVSASDMLEADPRSPNFGMPVSYHITSVISSSGSATFSGTQSQRMGVGSDVRQGEDLETLNNVQIHSSRAWRTDGVTISDRRRLRNGGWGDSVLERSYDPLRHWSSAMKSTGIIIQDFSQGVYKIKGLKELLAGGKEGLVRKRFQVMDQIRSVVNAILADADGEDFERKTTNVAGLSDLISEARLWMSAVSGMPLTKLFGISPGGFGTGESEGENWDDKVKAFQQKKLQPLLEYVYGLLFQTPEFAGVPDGWAIEFAPLQLESPEQESARKKTNAETDALYIGTGVLTPTEVAESRFGGAKYGEDIDLNAEARSAMAELPGEAEGFDEDAERLNAEAMAEQAPEPPESEPDAEAANVQSEAMNGAQVASLMSLADKVRAGEWSVETAIGVASVAFPTMSQEQARLIFESAFRSFQSDPPSPEPPPFAHDSRPGMSVDESARGATRDEGEEGEEGQNNLR